MTSFADEIAAFITAHNLTERRFGELALRDKNFVPDVLRENRSPSLKTVARVREFMATYRAAANDDDLPPEPNSGAKAA